MQRKEWTKKLKAAKKAREKAAKKGKKKGGAGDADAQDNRALMQEDEGMDGDLPTEDEYKTDPRFSFVKEGEHMNFHDLSYWLTRVLRSTGWNRDHPLIKALFRGIGVHHGGLPRKYNELVETLFRGKHIKVVVATNTLAMGINMPCRTTVFGGHTKMTTPLLYRQMQGRAGRRGYDDVGHVVFFGVDPRTVSRLMTSQLSTLSGHFPLNLTLILRMLTLYSEVKDKDAAMESFTNMVGKPYITATKPNATAKRLFLAQIKYQLRFSLEYFIQKRLALQNGKPSGLSKLVCHLHNVEPGNLILAELLGDGTIHKICRTFQEDKNQVAQNLLSLLCHIFMRISLPSGVTKEQFTDCPSLVMLRDLPRSEQRKVDHHNRRILEIQVSYIRSFCRAELKDVEYTSLPYSNIAFPSIDSYQTSKAEKPDDDKDDDNQDIVSALKFGSPGYVIRSPFVALSCPNKGNIDSFESSQELAQTVRAGVSLKASYLSVCDQNDIRCDELCLNSYALDFFRHGSMSFLVHHNNLQHSNVWTLLKEWELLLRDITEALSKMAPWQVKDSWVDQRYGAQKKVEEYICEDFVYNTFTYLYTKFADRVKGANSATTKSVLTMGKAK